jgi:hypothetical protein
MVPVYWIFRRFSAARVDKIFRRGQLLSAAAFSLGHGGNDAQKTMGIITAVLTAGGVWGMQYGPNGTLPTIPIEVVLSAHAAIALGTLSGGWRIVRTMGTRITKLKPVGGFCAETAAALTLAYVTLTGNSSLHHAHNHRLHRRRGRHPQIVSSQMGRRRPHRLGLDTHHPRRRLRRRRLLLDRLLHPPPDDLAIKSHKTLSNSGRATRFIFLRLLCLFVAMLSLWLTPA